MTDQKFIDEVYEIAFGYNARYRLTKEQGAYKHEEVLETLIEFSDKALEYDEPGTVGDRTKRQWEKQ